MSRATRDHPRSCGEHITSYERPRASEGSSPLVRGARQQPVDWCPSRGIIPARAGSTEDRVLPLVSARDHPRSCGEHWTSADPSFWYPGSSPLVRGAPHNPRATPGTVGIIPARAGSTKQGCIWWADAQDHPRSCGEHHIKDNFEETYKGSSPLVRGALRS